MKLPLKIELYLTEYSKELKYGIAGQNTTASVIPTTQKREIGSWACQLYKVNWELSKIGAKTTFEIWTTKDVPFNLKMVNSMMKNVRVLKGVLTWGSENIMKAMMNLEGFEIYSERCDSFNRTDKKSTKRVLEIIEQDASPEVYKIPKGYIKVLKILI
jgi:hypothetical protein